MIGLTIQLNKVEIAVQRLVTVADMTVCRLAPSFPTVPSRA